MLQADRAVLAINASISNMELKTPIQAVDLPGVPDLELQGLIVVVGPNSSGKTQFLYDLNEIICGRPREFVVVKAATFRSESSFQEYLQFLLDQNAIRQNSSDEFQKTSFQYGSDLSGGGTFGRRAIENAYRAFVEVAEDKHIGSVPQHDFLNVLGPLFCSALFLRNRLDLMNSGSNFDFRRQGPSLTLQSLYWNKNAKSALSGEIAQVFQRGIWVDNTVNSQLMIRVSDQPEVPNADDRLEPETMEAFRTIESEGDGLRSYAAICSTLLLQQRPLCLIDEPEMCLHPPQAHAMGRFIGTYASDRTCTVVATHSSHVLRGILETKPDVQVIRLTRADLTFQSHTLSANLLEEATSKPRSRSEVILEGLFSHAVILCEAEGDRLVYESAYRSFDDRRLDIRFAPSEGTGGFAAPLQLYRALRIPVAVVTDIDFLAKDGELSKVLKELGASNTKIKELCDRASQAVSQIRSSVSDTNIDQVRAKLNALAQEPISHTNNEDSVLRRELQKLVASLGRLGDFKLRGLEAIPESYGSSNALLHDDVKAILSDLQEFGLFLVPVGELESWLPTYMKGHSREDKSRWAMLAAEMIEGVGERDEDVWQFIHAVYNFLQKQTEALVEAS